MSSGSHVHKKTLALAITLFCLGSVAVAATHFTANGNVTVPSVTFGMGTADMLILNGSAAGHWDYASGVFTVTDPDTTAGFQVGSGDASVKSIYVKSGSTVSVCTENSVPGTSAASAPTAAGTYTIEPSTTTQCTSLCTVQATVTSFNSYPACIPTACIAGYALSGSGADTTCAAVGGGGVAGSAGASISLVAPQARLSTPALGLPPELASALAAASSTKTTAEKTTDISTILKKVADESDVYPQGSIYQWIVRKEKLNTVLGAKQFQTKYNIAKAGQAGYGTIGPKTLAKIRELKLQILQELIAQLQDQLETLAKIQSAL